MAEAARGAPGDGSPDPAGPSSDPSPQPGGRWWRRMQAASQVALITAGGTVLAAATAGILTLLGDGGSAPSINTVVSAPVSSLPTYYRPTVAITSWTEVPASVGMTYTFTGTVTHLSTDDVVHVVVQIKKNERKEVASSPSGDEWLISPRAVLSPDGQRWTVTWTIASAPKQGTWVALVYNTSIPGPASACTPPHCPGHETEPPSKYIPQLRRWGPDYPGVHASATTPVIRD